MEEPIFTQKETSFSSTDDNFLAFTDCPNKCVDGFYIDPYKHKRIRCSFCADKRRKIVRDGLKESGTTEGIAELLNFPKSFIGYSEFNIDSVIPDSARKFMIEDSVNKSISVLKDLINKVSIGETSTCSLLINLGSKAYDENFIFSYLFRAYEAGLTVAPYTSAYDLHLLRMDSEAGNFDARKAYNKLLSSEVCVLVIDAGATKTSIQGVKGLMQMRAYRNLSTIIVTHSWGREIYSMQCDDEDNSYVKNLAVLVSIEYNDKFKESEAKYQDSQPNSRLVNNRVGMSSDAFNNLMRPNQNL